MLECPHLFFKDCLKFGHKVLKTQSHKAYILCLPVLVSLWSKIDFL